MAFKTPVVVGSDGLLQQLQPGDTLNVPTAATNVRSVTNGNAGPITVGKPVYISGADRVDLAANNASGTSRVFGVVYDASISANGAGQVATDGPVTATTAQWDAITGGTGGLSAGTDYFLGATAGTLTATPPGTAGAYLVKVGTAVSPTVLEINLRDRILL